jgi:Xaa-Pro dipeptidase
VKERDCLVFPFSEYEKRVEALRTRMQERRFDCVIISDPSNLLYLTGYQTTGYTYFQALIVPIDGEPIMITRGMEESNVYARTWVEKTKTYEDTGDAIQLVVNTLKDMKSYNGRVGFERNSYFFPAYQQDRLLHAFRNKKAYDCYGIVEDGRVCKSKCEIEILKKAALATEAGMKAGIEAVKAGVTEDEIAAEICHEMFSKGGHYPAVLPYVTSGPRTMIGHATWEGRKVKEKEHVFLEVGGCFQRYHTAMMRTVVLGELTDSFRDAEKTIKYALDEVHTHFGPGLTVSNAHKIVKDVLSRNNCGGELITRAGYSIGVAFPPSWDEGSLISLKPGDKRELKEGMVFHVIPWLWGIDGDKTVGTSDTIYITEDGCKSFFSLEENFFVK